ncbi:MAG: hypothetical protein AAF495_24555 [Pseudomonadota bacterium]
MKALIPGALAIAIALLAVAPLTHDARAAVEAGEEIPQAKLKVFRQSCAVSAANGGMAQSRANGYCQCFVDRMHTNYSSRQFDAFERRVVQAIQSGGGAEVTRVFLNDDTLRGIMFNCLEQTQG